MMKYTLLNRRKSVKVKNNIEFITWMRKNDSQLWKCNEDFMEGYCYRKLTFEKMVIDHQTSDDFVMSLQKNNMLKVAYGNRSFWNFLKKQPYN